MQGSRNGLEENRLKTENYNQEQNQEHQRKETHFQRQKPKNKPTELTHFCLVESEMHQWELFERAESFSAASAERDDLKRQNLRLQTAFVQKRTDADLISVLQAFVQKGRHMKSEDVV